MGPGLGPVLPGVAGCVGADEGLFPVCRWAALVRPLQRLLVVSALVAEQFTEGRELRRVAYEAVPVVVPDLVPEMPENRPVWLVLHALLLLALHIVRFGNVDGDQSVVVTRQDAFAVPTRGVLQKLKLETRIMRLLLFDHLQTQTQ